MTTLHLSVCMMWCVASCYWSHISVGWPQYSLSAYLCISVHLLIFSSEVWPPRLLLAGSEGNAPLIMGTCPPNSSRHLTSKQTFVGCRVIGAPASRCKLDTSLVTTNIATRGTEEQPHHQVITYNDQSALSLVFCHNRQPAPVRATSQPDLLEE